MTNAKEEKFRMKLARLAVKNWWKLAIVAAVVLIVGGIVFSSCEIPTKNGILKKGGINTPWSK